MDDERPTDERGDSFFDKPGEGAPDPEEVPVAGSQPGTGVDGGIQKPADYYSGDRPGVLSSTGTIGSDGPTPPAGSGGRAGCPGWAMGCGAAVTLIAVVMIGLLWWGFSSGKMFTMVFSSAKPVISESANLDQETKDALNAEIDAFNENVQAKRITVEELQGPLTALQSAIQDQEIDESEAEDLLEAFRTLNERAVSEEF